MSLVILPDTLPRTICECLLDAENLVIREPDDRVNSIALKTLNSKELIEAYGAQAAMQRLTTPAIQRPHKINLNEYCNNYLLSHLAIAAVAAVVGALALGFAMNQAPAFILGGILGFSLSLFITGIRGAFALEAVKNAEGPRLLSNIQLGVENLDKLLALKDETESRIDFDMLTEQRELLTTALTSSINDASRMQLL